jgi:hypothetical protein
MITCLCCLHRELTPDETDLAEPCPCTGVYCRCCLLCDAHCRCLSPDPVAVDERQDDQGGQR